MDANFVKRTPKETEWLEKVRSICLALPETEESVDGFGHTTFKINGKSFARLSGTGDEPSLAFKSDLENQEFLVQQGGYFKTPYIGRYGWVSIKDPKVWAELGDLLKEAYWRAAPKRLAKRK